MKVRLNIRIDMRRNALRLLTPYCCAPPNKLNNLCRFFTPLAYMRLATLPG
jgi:hypothetical protein